MNPRSRQPDANGATGPASSPHPIPVTTRLLAPVTGLAIALAVGSAAGLVVGPGQNWLRAGWWTIGVLLGVFFWHALASARRRGLAEDALRESAEKLRGLYELSPLGIALTDMQGRYLEFNEAATPTRSSKRSTTGR
jgi:PAS domain-containing protein